MRNNLVLSSCFSEGFFFRFSIRSTCACMFYSFFFFARKMFLHETNPGSVGCLSSHRQLWPAAGARVSACQKPQCETVDHLHEMITVGEEGAHNKHLICPITISLLRLFLPSPPVMWLPCSWAAAHIASDLLDTHRQLQRGVEQHKHRQKTAASVCIGTHLKANNWGKCIYWHPPPPQRRNLISSDSGVSNYWLAKYGWRLAA